MKKCVYHLGFVSLCVVLSFGVTSSLCYADSSADLYPLAKKEGVIHFGGATSIEAMASTLKAFEEKYPGVKIQYNRKSSEALMSLIETERKANKVSFDLIKTSEPFDALELKNVGYWLQYRHENWAAIPDKFKDKDAYYVASNVGAMPGAYNPKVIPPSEAPKSLKDVIDPRWKNKMSHSSPSRAGTGLVAVARILDLYGWDFIKTLSDLGSMSVNGHGAVATMILSGERPLAWEMASYRCITEEMKGSPFKTIWFPEGVAVYFAYIGIPKLAPHPAGAKLLANFLMSKEGQDITVKTSYSWAVLPNMEPPPTLKPLEQTKLWYPDLESLLKNGKEITDRFDKMFGAK